MQFLLSRIAIVWSCVILTTLSSVQVLAADITVDMTCTLADAIQSANRDYSVGGCQAGQRSDTITILLSATRGGTIALESELPAITSTMTIEGNGFAISGNDQIRVFYVGENGNLKINQVTVTRGFADGGGGILIDGKAAILDSTISYNLSSGEGGGIQVNGFAEIIDSKIIYNVAKKTGGGIVINGEAIIENSSITDNSTRSDGSVFPGGGIAVEFKGEATIDSSHISRNSSGNDGGGINVSVASRLAISNSVINDNTAAYDGGGINVGFGEATIVQSTVDNNHASKYGGGISVGDDVDIVTITRSTVSNNSALYGGGISIHGLATISNSTLHNNVAESTGGGLWAENADTRLNHLTVVENFSPEWGGVFAIGELNSIRIRNSIFADNVSVDCAYDGQGYIQISGTLIESSRDCPEAQLIQDPLLEELYEPDDATPAYFPLSASSPAIDAGDDSYCATNDQRGKVRPLDDPCDIGAIEMIDHGAHN